MRQENSHCFQKMEQLFNIIQDYFPLRDSKRLECVKNVLSKRRNSTALSIILDFFKHTLILQKPAQSE